ncbi:MAG: inorganic pyrophosphatase [Polyangiaceae bacterium]|nr:inorganic pyrophosphatase [Polyangiaceae bacterium]
MSKSTPPDETIPLTDHHRVPNMVGGIFQAHPWHGVPIGEDFPEKVNCYIELVPTDTVKYELDKDSGHLKIDRPQLFSNTCPMPYGLVPQTLCDQRVAERCMEKTGRTDIVGDGDPIDICVISERPIPHGNLLLTARVIGGLRMIDNGEADDKLIAVMKQDPGFVNWKDIYDMPDAFIDRLRHYFITYKQRPGYTSPCEIAEVYDVREAQHMLRLSYEDYKDVYGLQHDELSHAQANRRKFRQGV